MADKDTHDYARERIKSSLTMEDILDAYYHTSPRKKVCCPFHEERTPSFSYKDDYYTCFGGCGAKGDTITFVQKYFNLQYSEALQKIDADFRLNIYNDESWKDPAAIKKTQAALEQRRKEQQRQLDEQNQINALHDEIAELEKECDKLRPPKGIEPEEKAVIAYLNAQETLRDKEVLLEELLTEQYAKRYQERIEKESRKSEQSVVSKKAEEREQSKVAKENQTKEEIELPPIMGKNGLPITLEEYERPPVIEEDDMKPRYLSPPELPGWKVELYDDGSGCFISPAGVSMYSFDKSTGEYKNEQGRWTDFIDDPGAPVSGDKDLVSKLIQHIAEGQSNFKQSPTEEASHAAPKNTVVVNLVAGPGAGKTTCSWEIAEKLKKQGYVVEYVSEVAKDYVWDENWELLDGSKKNQIALFEEQKHRIDRLIGKVDFVVTDSPLLLNAVYLTEGTEQDKKVYSEQVRNAFNQYNNFVIFIERGKGFEQAGRIHNEEQSRELDNQVKKLLADNEVYYGTYRHDTIDVSISNMIKTLNRIQKTKVQEQSHPNKPMTAQEKIKVANEVADNNPRGSMEGYVSDKTHTVPLSEAEARLALKLGIRLVLVSEIEDYHGSHSDHYSTIPLTKENADVFYASLKPGSFSNPRMYSHYKKSAYISPVYITEGTDITELKKIIEDELEEKFLSFEEWAAQDQTGESFDSLEQAQAMYEEYKSDFEYKAETQEGQENPPMLLEAHIYPLKNTVMGESGSRLLANVKVQLNGQVEFPAKIIEKKNGERFVTVPQYCTSDGNFRQIVKLETELNNRMQGEILRGYTENKPGHIKSGEPVSLDLKLKKLSLSDYEKIKGYASISIGDALTISRIKVVSANKGTFVAMPSMAAYTDKEGKTVYPDAVTVLDKALQKELNNTVITAYKAETEKRGQAKRQEPDETESSIDEYINYTNRLAVEKAGIQQVGVMPQQSAVGMGLE